ncbi:MAG: type I glyceraldehyde-3-phosphate dehydrogenase [bacterium]|nr:type I glyceraldehyde-3-phosphate dehydrogenase [bacterium]
MAIKVGINGFGRIGRMVFKEMQLRGGFDAIAVNDLTDPATLAHLLKYDSSYGKYPFPIRVEEDNIIAGEDTLKVLSTKDPAQLPWKSLGVEYVVESTGKFRKRDEVARHLDAGAKKVLLTVPAKDKVDATIVMGVNDKTYKPEHKIISNASCTTNCLAPMAKVLNDNFGIVKGLMTTVHSYTNDQVLLDFPHKDLRRARAAALSIIPTTTGAAKAIGEVIPELAGKMNGVALRVPTPVGSLTDLVVITEKDAAVDAINAAFKEAAEGDMKGILEYCEDEIVLRDVVGNPHSCIFDAPSTMVIAKNMVKVFGWYDNEWAYSVRCVDLIEMMAGRR